MSRKAGLSLLSMILLSVSLHAIPQREGQVTVASNSSSRTVENATQAAKDGDAQRPSLQHRNPRYQLSEGDILDLEFPFTPGFDQTVAVLPDGYVSLRGIGSLHVKGETVPELRHSLEQAYAKILRDPVIAVALRDFQKPYFIVGGQVQHPGKFDLRGDTTVMQAVEIAGGFNESAKHSQILLFRRVSDDWVEVKKLNLKDMLRGKNLSEDPHIMPGDMLFVPKNIVSKIKQFIPSTGMGVYYNPAHF
jgi:protein involved in polysaccharide export with SLBB domain